MSTDRAVNGHPHPFTSETLPPIPRMTEEEAQTHIMSAAEVAELRALQEAEINRRRNVAHRKAGNMKTSRDGAQYVRQQKGHSWLLGWILLGPLTCFIVPIYWSVSPNHYWHL